MQMRPWPLGDLTIAGKYSKIWYMHTWIRDVCDLIIKISQYFRRKRPHESEMTEEEAERRRRRRAARRAERLRMASTLASPTASVTSNPISNILGSTNPGTHIATDHEDTSEGAVHCFQDEFGNWHSYTFGQDSSGTASMVVPNVTTHFRQQPPLATSGTSRRASRSSSCVSTSSGLTVILDNPTMVFQVQWPVFKEFNLWWNLFFFLFSAQIRTWPQWSRGRIWGHSSINSTSASATVSTTSRYFSRDFRPQNTSASKPFTSICRKFAWKNKASHNACHRQFRGSGYQLRSDSYCCVLGLISVALWKNSRGQLKFNTTSPSSG